MRAPKERQPIAFRQLCAIARDLLTQSPTINDAEWKEQIKRRVIALEFTYPEPLDLLESAMSAVQQAIEKQWGPRPTLDARAPEANPTPDPPPLSRTEAAEILARIGAQGLVKPIASVPQITQRQADARTVVTMIAAEILSSIQRCEELEHDPDGRVSGVSRNSRMAGASTKSP